MRCHRCGISMQGYSIDAVICTDCAIQAEFEKEIEENGLESCSICGKQFTASFLDEQGRCIECAGYQINGWRAI
jgi:NMD protein affecting ribosome stability and mRNA decay